MEGVCPVLASQDMMGELDLLEKSLTFKAQCINYQLVVGCLNRNTLNCMPQLETYN